MQYFEMSVLVWIMAIETYCMRTFIGLYTIKQAFTAVRYMLHALQIKLFFSFMNFCIHAYKHTCTGDYLRQNTSLRTIK